MTRAIRTGAGMRKRILAALLAWLVAAVGALAEDAIAPDAFSFTGGTGRVTITCSRLWLEDGGARAEIVFSSPNYAYVKVDGVEYATTHEGETSAAVVPVNVNRTTQILAMTTAMSAPHEIAYTLYVGVDALSDGSALPGIAREDSLPLRYARGFSVDYYTGGYALIDVKDSARYLVVPQGMAAPEGIAPDIVVLQRPLKNIYLAATSAMALFDALDALDAVRLSGTQRDGWTVASAARAMDAGDMLFAGKYSEPDFELLLREGCDLAVESMMISHAPKVKEMLELVGIPVFVDRSSYEPHPLGRVEWIKLYGVLTGREEAAQARFDEQARIVEGLGEAGSTGKTVAFFYINASGAPVVRAPSDYIARMIALAGGRYAFEDLGDEGDARASVNITMEQFYQAAADADFLVYNAAVDSPVESVDALLEKCPLLADFRAVREGNVWCTGKGLYQATDRLGEAALDFHRMLAGETEGLTFLYRLD